MTETRHKAVIEVRGETRGLKDLGKEMDRAFNPARIEQMDASMKRFSRDVEDLAGGLKGVVKEIQEAVKALRDAGGGRGAGSGQGGASGGASGGGGQGGGGQGGGRRGPGWGAVGLAGVGGWAMGRGAASYNYGQGVAQAAASGSGLTETALNGIPIVGGFMAGAMGSARRYVGMSRAYSQAQAGSYGTAGRGVGGTRATGVSLGLDPSAMAGMVGQIGQSTGLRGEGLSDDLVNNLATYQRVLGIDGGGLIGANMSSGGTNGGFSGVEEAVGTAIDAGFREGKISEYLAEIAAFTEQTRRQGINISTDSANALTRGFSALGLSGEAASATGQSAREALRSAGDDNSYMSRVTAQVGMGEMGMSYVQARAAAEGDMAPDMLASVMRRMWADSGGNTEVMADLLHESGLAPSYQAALTMAGNFAAQEQGGDAVASFSRSSLTSEMSRESAGGLMSSRRPGFDDISGGAQRLAGMTSQDIDVGSQVDGVVTQIENIERSLTQGSVLFLAEAVQKLAAIGTQAMALVASGDFAGLFTMLFQLLQGAIPGNIPTSLPTATTQAQHNGRQRMAQGGVVNTVVGGAQVFASGVVRTAAGLPATAPPPSPLPPPPPPPPPRPPRARGRRAPGTQSDAAEAVQYHLQQAAEAAGQLGAMPEGDATPSYA